MKNGGSFVLGNVSCGINMCSKYVGGGSEKIKVKSEKWTLMGIRECFTWNKHE